jgi:hypothetical protein
LIPVSKDTGAVQELAVLYQKNKELMAGNEIASKRD